MSGAGAFERGLTARGLGLWLLGAFLCAAIALFSYRYLAAVGPMPSGVLDNLFARPWLLLHVAGAATALRVAPLQFLPAARRRRGLHRWLGRIYVLGCSLGGVAGLVLAFGSTAGPIATAGFGSLALAWLFSSMLAWRHAMARRFDKHRAWMIRSFALTFAAVTLRLYLPLLGPLHVDFVAGYRAISFLCWLPNLAIAELWLRLKR